MSNGLYINGVYVCEANTLRFTYQSNDLQEPSKFNTSFTSALTLPDSQLVRQLTEGAQASSSRSKIPYKKTLAKVEKDGQTVFSGFVLFKQFQAGWSVELTQAKKNIFERLNRSIKTANLLDYDFIWNLDTIHKAEANTEGIVFPLIDYGLIGDNKQPQDLMLPSVYFKTVLGRMLYQEGVKLTGLEHFDEYEHLIIPFVGENPVNNNSDYVADRQARATVKEHESLSVTRSGYIDYILPFAVVDQPLRGFSQGKQNNFKPLQNGYRVDSRMRLLIDCSINYKLKISVGAVRVQLIVLKNGEEAFVKEFTEEAITDILYVRRIVFGFSASIECKQGDLIQVKLVAKSFTVARLWFFEAFLDETCFVVFAPDSVVRFGDYFPVAPNLPDLTGIDLLKTVAFLASGTWEYKERMNELHFVQLTPVIEGKEHAIDWSSRVDQETEGALTPFLEPYGLLNRFTWKSVDKVPIGKTGYADGVITGGSGEPDVIVLELPFEASKESSAVIGGLDTIPLIKTRTIAVNAPPTGNAATPRLLLVDPSKTAPISTVVNVDVHGTVTTGSANLRLAWFDNVPSLVRLQPALRLSFPKLIGKYYKGLTKVLERPKTISVSMALTASDVANLDFGRLVRIRGTRAGSLLLEDGFYYLNKIENYQDGELATVTLVGT